MLISTVRSGTDQDGDYTRQLGFLVNPQRFNVSVTRARSLLIGESDLVVPGCSTCALCLFSLFFYSVIGDPYILTRDKCWGDYLEFAIERAAYVGDHFKSRARRLWEKQQAEREKARRAKHDAEQWEIRKRQIEITKQRAKIIAEKCPQVLLWDNSQEEW